MLSTLGQSADSVATGQNGLADLTLEYRAGITGLTRVRTRPPLMVQQALYPDDAMPDMAYVFLANPTGGLLENDRQEICISVGPGARAHVTTQSATKIHTMPSGLAEQSVALNIAGGGYLEYLPDPLIPFRNASLKQQVSITLETGAALIYGDVITPGRVASGEAFRYRRISNRLAVHRQHEHPAYVEAFDIAPTNCDPISMAVLGLPAASEAGSPNGHTLASVLVLCDADPAGCVLSLLRDALPACLMVQAGASILPDGNGVGVKIVGADRSAVQAAATYAWSVARRELVGSDAPDPRKY